MKFSSIISKLWKSVVVKLWWTILLFFSFVLIILTLSLTQFISNYVVDEVTGTLKNTASKIAIILESHDDLDFGLEVATEIIDDVTKVIIITDDSHVYYSSEEDKKNFPLQYFTQDDELAKVLKNNVTVTKEIELPQYDSQSANENEAIMIGVPLEMVSGEQGGVYIYQSLSVMRETIDATTRLIWLSALIAFILTTVFAFFLSTRLAAPLRKMREVAIEVANGKFDTKIPIVTNDEIGELGTALNQMRKRLKINMNALNQEKEQLTSILSSMADGVLMFNRSGKIIVTNPPAERFLELWRAEHSEEGKSSVPSKILDLYSEAVKTEREQTGDVTLNWRHWTVIVSPLYNQDTIRGAVVVLRDMTEERKLDKLRTDFVANVSHELRTPISMLQGYSEALMDDVAASEEERKEIATVINEESLRMGRLVNELLDLARMESGHTILHKEWIELSPFLQKVVKKFTGLAREKNIQLKINLTGPEETLYFDPDRIEQVFTNLIDNAIRHTGEGGLIEISESSSVTGVTIKVKDTGSGIPSEDLPFVFERFYKADKARTRGRAGTGLGLAIAKNIVDAHNGNITVDSKLGQGTTFTVFIPRKS